MQELKRFVCLCFVFLHIVFLGEESSMLLEVYLSVSFHSLNNVQA